MSPRYVVTVWRQDGSVLAETFTNQKAATDSYNRLVQPKNPHSLNRYVVISQVIRDYRHDPYEALKKK